LDGWGRNVMSEGQYYEGNFVENKMEGHGKMVDNTGRVHEGQWENN